MHVICINEAVISVFLACHTFVAAGSQVVGIGRSPSSLAAPLAGCSSSSSVVVCPSRTVLCHAAADRGASDCCSSGGYQPPSAHFTRHPAAGNDISQLKWEYKKTQKWRWTLKNVLKIPPDSGKAAHVVHTAAPMAHLHFSVKCMYFYANIYVAMWHETNMGPFKCTRSTMERRLSLRPCLENVVTYSFSHCLKCPHFIWFVWIVAHLSVFPQCTGIFACGCCWNNRFNEMWNKANENPLCFNVNEIIIYFSIANIDKVLTTGFMWVTWLSGDHWEWVLHCMYSVGALITEFIEYGLLSPTCVSLHTGGKRCPCSGSREEMHCRS